MVDAFANDNGQQQQQQHQGPIRSPSDLVGGVLNNKCETRKSKKKNTVNNTTAGLLLKGLGSMFRFGKHRKSTGPSHTSSSSDHQSGSHQSSGSDPATPSAMIVPSATTGGINYYHQERRTSGPGSLGRGSSSSGADVGDRNHVLRRTLPPDERDRAELGRQMAIAVARQVKSNLLIWPTLILDQINLI